MAKAETSIGEYTPAGYPKDNPKFREESKKVFDRGEEDRRTYDRYVHEWTTRLRAGLKPQRG